MRRWILFGCGGRRSSGRRSKLLLAELPVAPQVPPAVASRPQPIESPKPVPAKVVEVIDLARRRAGPASRRSRPGR